MVCESAAPFLPIMTFLKSCIDFLTHLLATPLLDFGRAGQVPLSFQVANPEGHAVASYPKIDPSSCRYPKLEARGYRHCNGDSRKCWLKKPYGYGPEWDIHTDYENFVPTGVVREVGEAITSIPYSLPTNSNAVLAHRRPNPQSVSRWPKKDWRCHLQWHLPWSYH